MTSGQPTNYHGELRWGHLPEFSTEKGDFEAYVQRFEAFANKIDKATKQQVFLTLIGAAAFISLQNLLFPKAPVEASFDYSDPANALQI